MLITHTQFARDIQKASLISASLDSRRLWIHSCSGICKHLVLRLPISFPHSIFHFWYFKKSGCSLNMFQTSFQVHRLFCFSKISCTLLVYCPHNYISRCNITTRHISLQHYLKKINNHRINYKPIIINIRIHESFFCLFVCIYCLQIIFWNWVKAWELVE